MICISKSFGRRSAMSESNRMCCSQFIFQIMHYCSPGLIYFKNLYARESELFTRHLIFNKFVCALYLLHFASNYLDSKIINIMEACNVVILMQFIKWLSDEPYFNNNYSPVFWYDLCKCDFLIYFILLHDTQ